jgi:simple sugar transport system ATP-binding protein
MNALQLEKIGKSFGAVEVLSDVTIGFEEGKVTAIVGDNGAGKSTLLKIISGAHAPDSGSIKLHGEDLTSLPVAAYRGHGIEMVYQDLALAKQQDVVANLFMGHEQASPVLGYLHRRRMTALARQELDKLGIRIGDLNAPVGSLSGGQQQSIAIARAALFDPKVLLLDEPTAALAAREVEHVLELIRQQRFLGRLIILVSHRLNDVFAVADRIIVMKQGRLVADDPVPATTLNRVIEKIVG